MELPIKLISTDFDGTIHSDFEQPPIPPVLENILEGFQSRGGVWVINTGRDLPSLLESLERAKVAIRPNYVVVVEREIHRYHDQAFHSVQEWNRECRRRHDELFLALEDRLEILKTKMKRHHAEAMVFSDEYSPICFVAQTPEQAEELHEMVETHCEDHPSALVMRNHIYGRMCHAEYHKGSALEAIAQEVGVEPSGILAAGDHLNDLPMLSRQYAHHLVAPSNAIPQVQQRIQDLGGHLSPLPWGHGVAEGIQRLLVAKGSAPSGT